MCKDNRNYLILPDGDYQSAANLELESDHISYNMHQDKDDISCPRPMQGILTAGNCEVYCIVCVSSLVDSSQGI